MANSYVQIPPNSTGPKLDTEQLTVGLNIVERERNQLAGVGAEAIAAVLDTDPALNDHGLVVRALNVVSPARSFLSTANLAAGATATLDGATIPAATTGKLLKVHLSSSAAAKWALAARDGAVVTTIAVLFTKGFERGEYVPPAKDCDTLVGDGVDTNFQVAVTNLDNENSADFYATLHWDEV